MKSSQRQIRPSTGYAGSGRFTDEEAQYERPVKSPNEPPSRGPVAYTDARPSLLRRLTAECVDRAIAVFLFPPILALPILLFGQKYFFPVWLFALTAWHLLRDNSPNQRSLGKRFHRLRVVMANGGGKCSWWRLILRRSGSAVSQLFYALALAMRFPYTDAGQSATGVAHYIFSLFGAGAPKPQILMLLAVIYDIVSLIAILISREGRRIEDLISGTRVIPESAFLEDRKPCAACRRLMSKRAASCQHCGALNFVRPEIRRRPNVGDD